MTLASVATASTVVASPSIAATDDACSWPDLAERFERYYARWCQRRKLDELCTAEYHDDPDLIEWGEISVEQYDLTRLILDKRPVTMADLILQARACAAENNELWTDTCTIESANPGALAFRRLTERLCEYAGARVFPDVAALRAPWSNDDTELLVLGTKFDELRDAIVAAEVENNRLLAPGHARVYALRNNQAAFEVALRQLDDDKIPGFPEVDKRLKEFDRRIDALLNSIIDIHSTSFAGVAVKLRALRWLANIEDEKPKITRDLEELWFNAIDRDVRRLAGEAVPRSVEISDAPMATERTTVDPVFDAIEVQRRAAMQLDTYLRLDEKLHDDGVVGDLHETEIAATDAFFRAAPCTPAGREALIEHALHVIQTECCGNFDDRASFVTCGQLVALLQSLRLDRALATA